MIDLAASVLFNFLIINHFFIQCLRLLNLNQIHFSLQDISRKEKNVLVTCLAESNIGTEKEKIKAKKETVTKLVENLVLEYADAKSHKRLKKRG